MTAAATRMTNRRYWATATIRLSMMVNPDRVFCVNRGRRAYAGVTSTSKLGLLKRLV